MKILMIHPHDIFSPLEPWTIRIVSCATELVKKGHTVKLAYFSRPFETNEIKVSTAGFEVINFDRRLGPRILFKNFKKMCALARWSDVIHFQKCLFWASLLALYAAFWTKKPLHYDWDDWEEQIWYESSNQGPSSKFIGFFLRILERSLPVLADSVSCASNQLKEMTIKLGVDRRFIFDAPVGADLVCFNPSISPGVIKQKYAAEDGLVIYLGQLHGAQYVDLFIQAASMVLQKKPRVKFLIIGDGYLKSQLERTVGELGLEQSIFFAGAVSHQSVPTYLAAATVCIACFKETLVTRCKSPLKLAEYMAAGKAIVANSVGDVKIMLSEAGILVSPGDSQELAQATLKILDNPEIRIMLEKASRKRAEDKYNWQATTRSLILAYEKIIASYAGI